jgi:hypothetical protein
LIPHLTACWGNPFDQDTPFHAAELRYRLLNPVGPLHHNPLGQPFQIQSGLQGAGFNIAVRSVPPGAKRTFVVQNGAAILQSPGHANTLIPLDQRIVVRANDFGNADIWVTNCPGVGGPVHALAAGQEAVLVHPDEGGPFDVEMWSCTCGRCHCDRKHRLSEWHPQAVAPNVSFRNWLLYAVRGHYPIVLGSFTASMYYGLLCDGV